MRIAASDRSPSAQRKEALVVLAFALAVLAINFVWVLALAIAAVRFPDELDYGEGIVWQQAASLFSGHAYGPIDGFPAIVYHYPPLYHAVTAAVSWVSGGASLLIAGRSVSIGSTIAIALIAAAIAVRTLPENCGRSTGRVVGAVAALGIFCSWPLLSWNPLMRVDMLAVALSFAGILLGLEALRRPGFIYLAALAFVAAVYTKQTAIAAPAALFLMLLLVRPILAVKYVATILVAGLLVLATLSWVTDGGFIRHILLYNINRFEPERWWWIRDIILINIFFFGSAAVAAWPRLQAMAQRSSGPFLRSLRETLNSRPSDAALLLVCFYFLTAGLLTLTVAKSGSSSNYFIEWLCVLAVLAGAALHVSVESVTTRDTSTPTTLRIMLPIMIGFQGIVALNGPSFSFTGDAKRNAELATLSARVRAAEKPVIADNMVLLLRSGKPVVWEPVIFAELAHTGAWDEKPFVNKICAQEFAFFITYGQHGAPLFLSRYSPAVAEAMKQAYPEIEELAGYTVHKPAANACSPGKVSEPGAAR